AAGLGIDFKNIQKEKRILLRHRIQGDIDLMSFLHRIAQQHGFGLFGIKISDLMVWKRYLQGIEEDRFPCLFPILYHGIACQRAGFKGGKILFIRTLLLEQLVDHAAITAVEYRKYYY